MLCCSGERYRAIMALLFFWGGGFQIIDPIRLYENVNYLLNDPGSNELQKVPLP